MPKIHENFYYLKTTSKQVYQESPTGNMEVNQLLRQNPYWIPATLPRERQPKKLIMADWSARNWSEEKLKKVIKSLGHLMNAGFSISIWQNGEVIDLNKDNLTMLLSKQVRKGVTPDFPDEIIKANKHPVYDEKLILDDYWIDYLTADKEELSQTHSLKTSDFACLSPSEQEKIMIILQQATPPISHIIHDVFSELGNIAYEKLQIRYPFLLTEIHYDKIELNRYAEHKGFILQGLPITSTKSSLLLTQNEMHDVRTIDYEFNLTSKELRALLGLAPNLMRLKIKKYEGEVAFTDGTFPNLEELDLNYEVSAANARLLLIVFTHLKKLKLSAISGLAKEMSLEELRHLSELEELSLEGKYQDDKVVQDSQLLLTAATNLKKLHLKILLDYPIKITPPPSLEEFSLVSSPMSLTNLHDIFAVASIKKLGAKSVHFLEDEKKDLNFKFLEQMSLQGSTLTCSTLNLLLRSAPKIRTLNIREIKLKSKVILQLEKNSLNYLVEMNLSDTSISNSGLQNLLLAAPNLKKLNLEGCRSLSLLEYSFEQLALEELNASSTNLTAVDIQKFLTASSRLKSLNLSYCRSLIAGEVLINENSLPYLERLILNESAISTASLKSLLLASSNLREISIEDCKELSGDWQITAEVIRGIEKLKIINSQITVSTLQFILTQKINLREFTLKSCIASEGELILEPGSLTNLTKLELIDAFTSSNIESLTKAAPNLKTLVIESPSETLNDLTFTGVRLNHLTSFQCLSSPISLLSLETLLQSAPNLETLQLVRCQKLSGQLNLAANSLVNLKKIDLYSCPLSLENLAALLNAAVDITRLEITYCKLENGIKTNIHSLVKLKELIISGSNVSGESLSVLLKAMPNLTEFSLLSGNLTGEVILSKNSLLSLEQISLSLTDISPKNLKLLLLAAPNLKKLNLSDFNIKHIEADRELARLLAPFNLEYSNKKDNESLFPNFDNTQEKIKGNGNPLPGHTPNPNAKEKIEGNGNPLPEHKPNPIPPTEDMPHDPRRHRNIKPTPEDFEFEYRGINKTKNQGMIIEKLSQYLYLTGKHKVIIPRIQKGICNALSHLFLDIKDPKEWDDFVEQVAQWNGREESLNLILKEHFERLYRYVFNYQLDSSQAPLQFLGANLSEFIKLKKPAILINPWHALAIKPKGNKWIVYDPNYLKGAKEIEQHELVDTIYHALGDLVSIEGSSIKIKPNIKDTQEFLEVGGLFILIDCENYQPILTQLMAEKTFTEPALEGLLLRDTRGTPAWVHGLERPQVRILTQRLLQEFNDKIPNAQAKLNESMAHLNDRKREQVTRIVASDSPLIKTFKTVADKSTNDGSRRINNKPLIKLSDDPVVSFSHYKKIFTTWKSVKGVTDNLLHYCQLCTQPLKQNRKRLIKASSTEEIFALKYSLEGFCHKIKRPVFVINSPEDLICSAPFISYNEESNTGQIQKGPGGRLYDFLQAHAGQSPVLLINYDRFSSSDLVRFNSLLDEKRMADGTALPEDALVIGLMNTERPDCYQGSDFYSRFEVRESCPIRQTHLLKAVPHVPIQENKALDTHAEKDYIINLFHAPDWENQLLGHWVLSGEQLVFKEGELAKAIASKKPIQLHNAPWDNDDFVHFWQEAYLANEIQTSGPKIKFPSSTRLSKHEGYDWTLLKQNVVMREGIASTGEVLNPTSLNDFLNRYQLGDNQKIKQSPGIIEAAKGLSLIVNLTRDLNEDEWARVLSTCQTHKVNLVVHCAPGVSVPAVFASQVKSQPISLEDWDKTTSATQVLISSEIDTSVSMITKKEGPWEVIDASECKPSDLLFCLKGRFNTQTLGFEFSGTENALLKALAEGKKVVLKGHFSAELCDALAPLLLQRLQGKETSGQLVVITEKTDNFNFASPLQHAVTESEKLEQLGIDEFTTSLLNPYIIEEPLSRLKARMRYLATHSSSKANSEEAWLGLDNLSVDFQRIVDFNPETSEEETLLFTEGRRRQINAVLEKSPYAFLAGLSGVGKSTFVENEFLQDAGQLYTGEVNINAWAKSKVSGKKILFIDEANLSQKQFSEFEGLFNNPPSILIDGVLHTLTADHKVLFAGNPLSYGDERKLAPFFMRHGSAVVFNPLPPAVLYEKILKPVFAKTHLNEEQEIISRHILSIYSFLCACSTTDILITPRELQMMALLVLVKSKKNSNLDSLELTKQVAFDLARPLVPAHRVKEFEDQFKTKPLFSRTTENLKYGNQQFFITQSRQSIVTQLNDLLDLCEFRSDSSITLHPAQLYGGLGGIIIEGEPGIGKSELLQILFAARGYQQVHSEDSVKEKPFYVIPASMPQEKKELLLRKAFDEGAKVILEEVNSSPMMEHLLNHLLMGKTPENQRPSNPGFMVFGTQNPTTMAGRRAPSTALSRRLITMTLSEYPTEEMKHILNCLGLPAERTEVMVKAFEEQLTFAKQHRLTPAPTFRDLLHSAKREIEEVQILKDINVSSHAKDSSNIIPLTPTRVLPHQSLIESVKQYLDTLLYQDEGLVLPFQLSKKEKLQAGRQLVNALEDSSLLIDKKNKVILLSKGWIEIITKALNQRYCQDAHIFLGANKPFTKVEDLIDFINQRNPIETLINLLQECSSEPENVNNSLYGFFNKNSMTQRDLAKKLSFQLENENEVLNLPNNINELMQGHIGDKINELIACYERVNNIKIKGLDHFINHCKGTPDFISPQSTTLF